MLTQTFTSYLNETILIKTFLKVTGTVLEDGSLKKGAPVFIVLSDGEARDKNRRDQAIIDKYQQMSRMQIAVGVGPGFNQAELERI